MAHLIELTNSDTREKILFNLDTVVSIETFTGTKTIITTRWGRTNVEESLNHIKSEAELTTKKEAVVPF